MDKMKFETTDITAENVAKLAELFPGVVAEGKVNVDLLRSYVGEEVFGDEAYEFTWVGKRAAIAEAGRPIRKTLRPCEEESRDWDSTENLYIEGDNLDVLKLLQESYLGKVKMIYIDPPYNTGNDFVYRDDFSQRHREYEEEAGVFDEDGDRLFLNTESNGRFHSDWCSMIYPRLVLARNLLRDDGVVFISIDDGEVAQLRKICDEVFGASRFIAQFPWRKRTAKSDVPFGVSQDYEWIAAYAKGYSFIAGIESSSRKYYESDDYPNRPWRIHDMRKQTTASERPNSFFDIVNPKTGKSYPANPNAVWRITKDTFQNYYDGGRIVFPDDYSFLNIKQPVLRYFKDDDAKKDRERFGYSSISTNLPKEVGMTQDGTKDVDALFDSKVFGFPKPVSLIRYLIQIASIMDKDSIILDFFSGSAATAHAVMQLNAEDGGKRKFIMVQLPEVCAEGTEAAKAGYKNICEIGKERIRRAGAKIKEEAGLMAKDLDIGFRVLKLDDSNMNDVYYAASEYTQENLSLFESNIKPDRTDMDLLFGCLLDWGLPLSMPHTHEIIDGFTVHTYNGGDLIACFADKISDAVVKEIAKRQPLRAVFRDSSFMSSPEKINVAEIFKLFAPNTTVKVI
ncbi:MAG: site-specific DNA-methyltransferase [Oscillospiraceae bacterium]|nr:site-specific DNA-methyltransferase [Oscillospiraceae bacterium]